MQLSESAYTAAASSELRLLVDALDSIGEEVDVELSNDILTLEFANRDRCVVNSHRAARQIWMAANRSAWHFDCGADGQWRATKTGEELWAVLGQLLHEKLGRPVPLKRA